MTAAPMPAVPHALPDIATWYADALTRFGVDLARFFTAAAADRSKMAVAWLDSPAWVGDALEEFAEKPGQGLRP